tara:strand:+ start:547 stop:933 length:387 start_codon:yes stop_codon:yes gene_type:complete
VSLLAGESTISAVVGSRVYVSRAPQTAALPYILITQLDSDEYNTLDGTTGLRVLNFDIDCKSNRSVQAMSLGTIVRDFIKDYTGTAGLQTVKAVQLNSESTEYESPTDGSDSGIHITLLDVSIQYSPV